MNFTHSQLLSLTGMTPDRLRHWRKEIPGLNTRAGRSGKLTFEEVALLAVLSKAADELGLSVALIAAHYEDLLTAFQTNSRVGEADIVLWLGVDNARLGSPAQPPEGDCLVMVQVTPVLASLVDEVRRPSSTSLPLFERLTD